MQFNHVKSVILRINIRNKYPSTFLSNLQLSKTFLLILLKIYFEFPCNVNFYVIKYPIIHTCT